MGALSRCLEAGLYRGSKSGDTPGPEPPDIPAGFGVPGFRVPSEETEPAWGLGQEGPLRTPHLQGMSTEAALALRWLLPKVSESHRCPGAASPAIVHSDTALCRSVTFSRKGRGVLASEGAKAWDI